MWWNALACIHREGYRPRRSIPIADVGVAMIGDPDLASSYVSLLGDHVSDEMSLVAEVSNGAFIPRKSKQELLPKFPGSSPMSATSS